jgi:hypothetical protein
MCVPKGKVSSAGLKKSVDSSPASMSAGRLLP